MNKPEGTSGGRLASERRAEARCRSGATLAGLENNRVLEGAEQEVQREKAHLCPKERSDRSKEHTKRFDYGGRNREQKKQIGGIVETTREEPSRDRERKTTYYVGLRKKDAWFLNEGGSRGDLQRVLR